MSHATKADRLLIKPAAGRQTGAAAHTWTVHSQGTHVAASHPTSHTRHGDNQAGDTSRQTNPPSLTEARASGAM
jgi:hypothetical protein